MSVANVSMQNASAAARRRPAAGRKTSKTPGAAFFGYSSLALALVLGWFFRDRLPFGPEEGFGYWLGITGASMIVLLLFYPVRKRIRLFHGLGPLRHWFRIHMMLGLVGPTLILYHSKFQLGSFNSRVALFSMVIVSSSGLVGRHLYSRIHRGLYGQKTSLAELNAELTDSLERSYGLASIMPNLVSSLEMLSDELQGDRITRSLGVRRSLLWSIRQFALRHKLFRIARRELDDQAARSEVVARDYQKLSRTTKAYIREYVRLMTRVAQFSFYERLFSLWHVLHLPLFLMLVVTAIVHVLVVHMY
jgi:hypothetical protein